MSTNVGSLDRMLRFVLGAILALAPFVAAQSFVAMGAWRYAVVAVGLVLLATALFRFCPAYLLFGVRTCAIDRA